MWTRVFVGAMTYSAVRNTIILSTIPMKTDELYSHRVALVGLNTLLSPFYWPMMIGSDIANIERKFRGMDTKVYIPFD